MLTVRELIADLKLPLLAGEGGLDLPIRWVHMSELLDPTGAKDNIRYGVNRNLVVDSRVLDPLSQVPRLNGQAVRVYRAPEVAQNT